MLKKFESHLKIIIAVRNVCAHGGVIFDFKTSKGISVIQGLDFETSERHSMHVVLRLISFYLGRISSNRKIDFEATLLSFFGQFSDNKNISELIERNFGHFFEEKTL